MGVVHLRANIDSQRVAILESGHRYCCPLSCGARPSIGCLCARRRRRRPASGARHCAGVRPMDLNNMFDGGDRMSDAETPKEALEEQAVEETKEPPKTPAPTATGNERITILKHSLFRAHVDSPGSVFPARVELAIRNVLDSTIATAVFEAVLYDKEGNIVDTVKHREMDLRPNTSRAINITSTITEYDRLESYDVRVIRTTTADVEKVQLCRHRIRTTEAGEEEIRGTVKNLSEVKTDAALVATFYDAKKENIGTKVLVLRDIEPNTLRQYVLKFKPQEGDRVRSCSLAVGEIVE
jgi:hypothetical protein